MSQRQLKLSSGGTLIYQSHNVEPLDVSTQALEYLFEGVEFDTDVLLRDLLLILRRNPILLQVFSRLRAEAIVESALAEPIDESPGYGVENIEYLELVWGWSSGGKGLFSIWPKMSMSGIGYELREPLHTDYSCFPAGARQKWALEFCGPRELVNYPLRINSKIHMAPDCQPELIDLDFPDLGKVIEGALFCLSWFGSDDDREEIKSEILRASAEGPFYEIDADGSIKDIGMTPANTWQEME